MIPRLPHFKFWCQKVLPLVYDNSLSYYEVLCKVVKYINELITTDNHIIENIEALQRELAIVQKWIEDFDDNAEKVMREIIDKYIATMVFFEITDDGYFVAYIPDSWENIEFNTTGLDIFLEMQPEYGHLVLSY